MTHLEHAAVETFYIACAIIQLTWSLTGFVIFLWRRNLQPIKARNILLISIATMSGGFVTQVWLWWPVFWTSFPCELILLCTGVMSFIVLDAVFARVWLIWFQFSLTFEMVEYDIYDYMLPCDHPDATYPKVSLRGEREDEHKCLGCHDERVWYFTHGAYGTKKFTYKVAVCVFMFQIIPALVEFNLPSEECGTIIVRDWVMVWCLVIIIPIFYTAWKYRSLKDGYYFKLELKGLLAGAVLGFLLNLTGRFDMRTEDHIFPFSLTAYILMGMIFALFAFWIPIYRTYSYGDPSDGEWRENVSVASLESPKVEHNFAEISDTGLFEMLIGCNQGREAFKAHLMREFAVENLLFYLDVENLVDLRRENENIQIINTIAMELYLRYIQEYSREQINISFTEVADIKNALCEVVEFDEIVAYVKESGLTDDVPEDCVVRCSELVDFQPFLEAQVVVKNLMTTAIVRFRKDKTDMELGYLCDPNVDAGVNMELAVCNV